jgi:nucleoside-diphosphate-sugar epimerase
MKILLTGGCGYIGTNLTSSLLEQEHHVTVVDIMWFGNYLNPHENLDIIQADIRDIEKIPMDGVDTVIHLANIANDPTGDLNARLTWEVNALSSKFLIEKAIDKNVKQFIFASSGSVYGIKEELQVTEDLPLVPITDYNKTKMISESVLLNYRDKIKLHIVRPATVCGYSPRMRLDLSVSLLTMHALTKGKITVFGGKQIRPNIHINDMVRVYLHFLGDGSADAGIYNAGFENISILDIANKVSKHIPSEIIVTESEDPRSYRLNSEKLLATGFRPKCNVEKGIQDLIKAYQEGKFVDEDRFYNMKIMMQLFA